MLQPSAFAQREAAPPQGSVDGSPSSEGVPGHAGATTAPTEPVSTGAQAGTERLTPQTPSFHIFGVTANISPYRQYCGPPRDPCGARVPPGPCRTTEGGKDSSGLRLISPSLHCRCICYCPTRPYLPPSWLTRITRSWGSPPPPCCWDDCSS